MKRSMLLLAIIFILFLSLDSQKEDAQSGMGKIASGLNFAGLSLAAQDNVRIKLKKKQTFEGYYKGYFSPDSTRLALLYREHIDMVEVSSGRRLFRLQIPQSQFFNVTFAPDGRAFATASIEVRSNDQLEKLVLWDAATGREIRTFVSDSPGLNAVYNLSFSKDGKWLASHVGRIARIFEVETGQEVQRCEPPADPPGLLPAASLLSPDGKWLAVNFRKFIPPLFHDVVRVLDLNSRRVIDLETNVYRDWRFSSDSTTLAITASIERGTVNQRAVSETWEVGSWTRKQVIEVPSAWQGAFTLSISPTSEMSAIGGRKKFGLFSTATGGLLTEKSHPTEEFDSQIFYDLTWIEFSPDGKTLLTAGEDSHVRLWKIKKIN